MRSRNRSHINIAAGGVATVLAFCFIENIPTIVILINIFIYLFNVSDLHDFSKIQIKKSISLFLCIAA